jgi:hypothetical protein
MTYSYVLPLKLNYCTSFLMFNALFMQSASLIRTFLKFRLIKNYRELMTYALPSATTKLY